MPESALPFGAEQYSPTLNEYRNEKREERQNGACSSYDLSHIIHKIKGLDLRQLKTIQNTIL
jgi:hypothetical protein